MAANWNSPRAEVDVVSCPVPFTRITVAPSTGVFPASRTTPTIVVVAKRGRAFSSTKSTANRRGIHVRTREVINADYRPHRFSKVGTYWPSFLVQKTIFDSTDRRRAAARRSARAGVPASFGRHAFVFAFAGGHEGKVTSGRYLTDNRQDVAAMGCFLLFEAKLLASRQQPDRFANPLLPCFRSFSHINPNYELTAVSWRQLPKELPRLVVCLQCFGYEDR